MLHTQTWESTVRSQLLETHASAIQCPTFFRKGKTPVLQSQKERHFPGLFDLLEVEGMSQADSLVVSEQFFAALYGQPSSSSMTQTRYNVYIRKQGKPMCIMLLLPMHVNIFLHGMG